MNDSLNGPAFASCRLDAGARRERADEFGALLIPNIVGVERSAARLTLALDLGSDALHDLARLLERERECCSFWRFALSPSASGPTRLIVEVAPGHEPALEALHELVDGPRR